MSTGCECEWSAGVAALAAAAFGNILAYFNKGATSLI